MATDYSETTAAIQVALDGDSGSDLSDADLTVQLVVDNGGWTGTVSSSVPARHNSNKLLQTAAQTTVHLIVWYSLEASIADSVDSWVDTPGATLAGAAVLAAGLEVWTESTTHTVPALSLIHI